MLLFLYGPLDRKFDDYFMVTRLKGASVKVMLHMTCDITGCMWMQGNSCLKKQMNSVIWHQCSKLIYSGWQPTRETGSNWYFSITFKFTMSDNVPLKLFSSRQLLRHLFQSEWCNTPLNSNSIRTHAGQQHASFIIKNSKIVFLESTAHTNLKANKKIPTCSWSLN